MKNIRSFIRVVTIIVAILLFTVSVAAEVLRYDVNSDGKVSISDAVVVQRLASEDIVEIKDDVDPDVDEDGKLSAKDVVEILKYLNKVSSEETTTTTTTSTTTTITTMTSKSTTTSTTTTTTSKTTTTSTTTTTTTSKSTTTSTTTTITTKTLQEELGELNFSQLLNEIKVDEEIPNSSIKEGEEKQDAVFSFTYNGNTFAYTLLSEEELSISELLLKPTKISGIHLWNSNNTQETIDVGKQYELPDTEGKTFAYREKEYKYQLREYERISATNITSVSKLLGGTKSYGASGYSYISQFDYNLSGELDVDDLKTMLKHYTSNISKFLIGTEWYLFTFLYDFTELGENCTIYFTQEILENTYVLPTQEYVNSCDELEKVHAVKVVKSEEYEAETGEKAETEYMLCIPEFFKEEVQWIALDSEFSHAGFAVKFE